MPYWNYSKMIPDRYFLLFLWVFSLSDFKGTEATKHAEQTYLLCILTKMILNRPLFRVLSVNQTDTSLSPVQPLKPQTSITSMGLESDPQPDELFLQNSTANNRQSSRPWETKATATTITTFESVQPHWRAQKRWNNDMKRLSWWCRNESVQ